MEKRKTIGVDMGDKTHSICVLDAQSEIQERATSGA